MAKISTIVLDIDDTVINFTGYLCYLYNQKNGTSISEHDLTTWNFQKVHIEDMQGNTVKGGQVRKFFLDYEPHGLYSSLPAIRESVMAMEIMKKLGYKIILLTARDETYRKDTELSLLSHNIPYNDLILNADKDKQINRLARRHHIVMFADDKFDHVKAVYETDKVDACYLLSKPHNRGKELGEGIHRVNDLLETVRFLKEV